eukprot:GHVP01005728.1.p1 GENE.GHVP01005728.1~~GHVP01005728.1.p1  ORF type:complete len:101 (-),score=27.96 GHVP01005728.1:122-424(-)
MMRKKQARDGKEKDPKGKQKRKRIEKREKQKRKRIEKREAREEEEQEWINAQKKDRAEKNAKTKKMIFIGGGSILGVVLVGFILWFILKGAKDESSNKAF